MSTAVVATRQPCLLVVGLGDETVALAARLAGVDAVVALNDVHEARRWVAGNPGESVVVAARFHESDAWSLSALLATLPRAEGTVLLLADVPRPALPVLITDHPGVVAIDPEDRPALESAVSAALRGLGASSPRRS